MFGAAVLCLWTLYSCRKPDVSEPYYTVIPADCRGVCAVNVNRLIEKGEIAESLQERLLGALRLPEVLKKADESGIDFSEYVFVVADNIGDNGALVARVKDAARLRNIFACAEKEGMCTPLVSRGKYNETIISGEVVCRFDSEVLFCTMSCNPEQAREYALRISERKGESIAADPCFRKMLEGKNDIELLFPMTNLPESVKSSVMTYTTVPDVDVDRMSVYGSLNFEKGRWCLQYTLLSADPAVMQALSEQGCCPGKVTERFQNCYPASTLLCALYNCQGDRASKLLENIGFWRNAPMIDAAAVRKVLASLDGDMAYGITGLSLMGMPNILVYAQVKDAYPADLLADVLKKNLKSVGVLKEIGKHRYEFGIQVMDFYFGVKDGNLFYLTNDPEAYRNLGKAVENPWNKSVMASGIKGSYGGIVLNIEELLRSPIVLLMAQQTAGRQQAALWQKVLSEFSYTEFVAVAPNQAVWNMYMKDQEQNSLKILLETVKGVTGMN